MEDVRNVVVAGGDLRQVYAANTFAQEGYAVTAIGFDEDLPFERVVRSDDLLELAHADLILFPLSVSRDGFLNTPLYKGRIVLEDCLRLIPEGCRIFGGNVTEEERKLAEQYNLELWDFFKVEELTVANALLTAEAALQIAMEQLPVCLWKCRCLIGGYGRIGRLLAERLKAFGAHVTVAARNPEQRLWAECSGFTAVDFTEVPAMLSDIQLIFNTIPKQWLDQQLLSRTKAESLLMELASKPYGIDAEAAKLLNRRFILASGLPGKHSAKSAGELIAKTVLKLCGRE